MRKIEIAALLTDSKKIIELLQRRGIVELSNFEDEKLVKTNTSASMAMFEKSRTAAVQALEIINDAAPEKTSLLSSFAGKREIEKHDFGNKAGGLENAMKSVYEVIACNKKIGDCKNEISRLTVLSDSLTVWMPLDVPMNYKGTQNTRCVIGSLQGQHTQEELNGFATDKAHVDIISSYKDQTNIAVTCLTEDFAEVTQSLRDNGFAAISEPSKLVPKEQFEIYKKQQDDARKAIDECTARIKELASLRSDFEFFVDYLTMRKDKYEAINKLAMTENTFIAQGYIPKKYADRLVRELDSRYTVAITLTEPEPDDDVPVLLENGAFSSPVEGITEMYALPNKHDVDPAPIMAFFYYMFFGIMLSDAGYGLLMVLGTTIALKKFNFEEKMRKTLRMFQYCGISTVIWGALFGSWFGDIVQIIAKQFFGKDIGSIALWFEPLDDPMKMLLFSFALGIAHLFLGLGVNFYMQWRDGKKWDAIFDVIPVYLTVLGVAPLAAGILAPIPAAIANVGKYVALVGVALIILTAGRSSKSIFMRFFGGIYGLYNIATGYLSDILSYSRLLALGLATGSIAGVINLIGSMPSNLVVKAIALVIVFVVGHTANLAINLLGAYVHTDRLQFVELFSKFYEGGGREFSPLSVKTKYIKLKGDTANE